MTKILLLYRRGFDTLENHESDAIHEELITTFCDEPGATAWAKLEKYVQKMDPVALYLAYNNQLYPQYRVVENYAK